jgi:plasmid stabilization system protein ParE
MPSSRKYQVRLTDLAEQDVDSVLRWLGEKASAAVAGKWFTELMVAIDTLESMPERCALEAEAPDLEREIRELLIGKRRGKYRVIFEIRGRTVHILRIWHGARDALTPKDV